VRGGRQGGAQVLAADALLPDDDMPDVLNADTLLPDDDDNDTRWHGAVKAPFCLIFFVFPEGPEKTTRGGGEWEPIKILLENLTYIPKSTQNSSLLTWPRPPSYRQAIGLSNRARNCSGNTKWC
jgi:hypothetical protein